MVNAGMHMLLLTADPLLASAVTQVSAELGIEAQSSVDYQKASDELSRTKYEGVVVDFDTVPETRLLLACVHANPSTKAAVVFAVATNAKHRDQALEDGAHFVLQRPIETATLKHTLRTAYDLMVGERRRYFRCAAELPVNLTIITSRTTLPCVTMNISSNGMAVKTPVPLKLAETLDIALSLPDGFTLRATGLVIWDDKHGKCGLKLQCSGPEMRKRLDSWLDSRFDAVKLT